MLPLSGAEFTTVVQLLGLALQSSGEAFAAFQHRPSSLVLGCFVSQRPAAQLQAPLLRALLALCGTVHRAGTCAMDQRGLTEAEACYRATVRARA
jgi:hypothetical protein